MAYHVMMGGGYCDQRDQNIYFKTYEVHNIRNIELGLQKKLKRVPTPIFLNFENSTEQHSTPTVKLTNHQRICITKIN